MGSRHWRGYRNSGRDTALPAKYSPDLNPIEMPYSKFKTFLRKVAARTIPSLNRAIRSNPTAESLRMCQLFQACRLCFNMIGIRFSSTAERVPAFAGSPSHKRKSRTPAYLSILDKFRGGQF